jgi:amylosucrase
MHNGPRATTDLTALAGSFAPAAAARFKRHGGRLLDRLHALYGDTEGFAAWFESLVRALAERSAQRPAELQALDDARSAAPGWFTGQQMIGYSAYADRFGGTLAGVAARIPYLSQLGVNYLHLLPFLRARAGDNDGGFAVASFEDVDPALGTNGDLDTLTAHLRGAGISLVADLVLNHVADDHAWAVAARAGDAAKRAYFHVLADPASVQAYEAHLHEVFPGAAPGNFTLVEAMGGWVWTTFYPYQWDLNYANPQVFAEIALAMMGLANRGVEVFRLDSAPFLWKRQGTDCRNLPQVHTVLEALRAVVDICAPATLLKAEAIVPIRELGPYFGAAGRPPQCHLAYHSSLMAASWVALVREDCSVLAQVAAQTPPLPAGGAWVTYVRCHDDIVWGVLPPAAAADTVAALGPVAAFLQGETADSYARGRASFAPGAGAAVHGTNGMTASLVGLGTARTEDGQEAALRRLLLLYGLAMTFGGIPLIYMGDELGQGNDESPQALERSRIDARWIQRPHLDAARAAQRDDRSTPAGAVWSALRTWIGRRKRVAALRAEVPCTLAVAGDAAVLIVRRGGDFVAVLNFAATPRAVQLPVPGRWDDLASGRRQGETEVLGAWEMRWLVAAQPDTPAEPA